MNNPQQSDQQNDLASGTQGHSDSTPPPSGADTKANDGHLSVWWDRHLTVAASIATIVGTLIAIIAFLVANNSKPKVDEPTGDDPIVEHRPLGTADTRDLQDSSSSSEPITTVSPSPLQISDTAVVWSRRDGSTRMISSNDVIPPGERWYLSYKANNPHYIALYQFEPDSDLDDGGTYRRIYPIPGMSPEERPIASGDSLTIPPNFAESDLVTEFQTDPEDDIAFFAIVASRKPIPDKLDVAAVLPDDEATRSRTSVVIKRRTDTFAVATVAFTVAESADDTPSN